ncbi:MAG TPA: U32 family peptidase [Deltaproteobacteria bacterium]|nr:U32 family peptidase [Deltaproteobacteria bacterium]
MKKVELVCPAGNLPSLKAAIDNGADVVYTGFNDATNARNFEGLNFTADGLREGMDYAHSRGREVYIAVNTFPQADTYEQWYRSVDFAVELGADAVILANLGILRYARERYPDAVLHLSVQASASNYEAINFYRREFGIRRVVLPRVVTVDEIRRIREMTDVELEVFALGGLCINIEGRCYLSSFVTGASTNTEGACSPSRFVRFDSGDDGGLRISLNSMVLNDLAAGESSPYPTCCKGRYVMPDGRTSYAMEDPESLNVLSIVPELIEAGISAFKIEGRQRTRSYVAAMTRVMREAVDSYYRDPASYAVRPRWQAATDATFEGTTHTLGCYRGK